jgi:hypothetical protein
MKLESKKQEMASRMMKKNNRLMLEIDKHNRSWNGKEYTHKSQKGKGSLNPPHKGRDNEVMEGKGEQEKN